MFEMVIQFGSIDVKKSMYKLTSTSSVRKTSIWKSLLNILWKSFWFFQELPKSASLQVLLLFQITKDIKKFFKLLLIYVQEIFQTSSTLCSRYFPTSFKGFIIVFTLFVFMLALPAQLFLGKIQKEWWNSVIYVPVLACLISVTQFSLVFDGIPIDFILSLSFSLP